MTSAQAPPEYDTTPERPPGLDTGKSRGSRGSELTRRIRRGLVRTLLIVTGLVVVGLLYTGYKRIFAATEGMWPGTQTALPVAGDDLTMPPLVDILRRLGEPQRIGDDMPLWRALIDAALVTFRESFTGFAIGLVVGLVLALLMLRFLPLERGFLPCIIVSQTVPLIALAPIIVGWGNQIDFGLFEWEQWMSVSLIAAYLTFFPVSVNMLRGLQSPTPTAVELMRSNAATWTQTLLKLRLPASVPFLVPALKLAATASVVGAIVGEISTGVAGGIGRAIIQYSQQYMGDPERLYGAVITAGLLGVAFVAIIDLLDLFLMRNRPKETT